MSQADETTAYKKCINCGKYCPEGGMIAAQFCSEECAVYYKRCLHCGNYFKLEDQDQTFCSIACQNADKFHIPGDD